MEAPVSVVAERSREDHRRTDQRNKDEDKGTSNNRRTVGVDGKVFLMDWDKFWMSPKTDLNLTLRLWRYLISEKLADHGYIRSMVTGAATTERAPLRLATWRDDKDLEWFWQELNSLQEGRES